MTGTHNGGPSNNVPLYRVYATLKTLDYYSASHCSMVGKHRLFVLQQSRYLLISFLLCKPISPHSLDGSSSFFCHLIIIAAIFRFHLQPWQMHPQNLHGLKSSTILSHFSTPVSFDWLPPRNGAIF